MLARIALLPRSVSARVRFIASSSKFWWIGTKLVYTCCRLFTPNKSIFHKRFSLFISPRVATTQLPAQPDIIMIAIESLASINLSANEQLAVHFGFASTWALFHYALADSDAQISGVVAWWVVRLFIKFSIERREKNESCRHFGFQAGVCVALWIKNDFFIIYAEQRGENSVNEPRWPAEIFVNIFSAAAAIGKTFSLTHIARWSAGEKSFSAVS